MPLGANGVHGALMLEDGAYFTLSDFDPEQERLKERQKREKEGRNK